MRKRETILIGEEFNKKSSILKDFSYFRDFKSLYECYSRCSEAKHNIYNYYEKLLFNNCDRVLEYGVRSYNSMIIVLHAIVEKEGKKYYLMITPSYNWYCDYEEN